jgi:hypothetical protein
MGDHIRSQVWHKNTKWEEFDKLAKGTFDEEVASTTTGISQAFENRKSTPKLISNQSMTAQPVKSKSYANFNHQPARRKTKNYKPYDYYDVNEDVPVSVVYQEIDTLQDLSQYAANKLPKSRETKSSPARNRKNKQQLRDYKHQQNEEYLVQMDTSFNKDLAKLKSRKSTTSSIPIPALENNDENSLELSPIRQSERSHQDNTFDDIEVASTGTFARDTLANPVITPLYKEPKQQPRRRKYMTVNLDRVSSTQSEPVKKKHRRRSPRKLKEEFKLPQKGFKDLEMYENFKVDLEDVPERYEEESSEPSSAQSGKQWSKTQTFYVPDDSEERVQNGRTFSRNTPTLNDAASVLSTTSAVKARIRRYGKNKYERELALR